jgi:methylenetetrahydrofolate reductase (NADPH)
MALRGDAMKDEQSLSQNGWKQPCYRFVQQIKLLNEGKYLHEVVHVDNKSRFLYCVAGYPEKHLESPLYSDLKGLKKSRRRS